MSHVLAVAASYGAAGSRIAPALADALGVEFMDRVVPAARAEAAVAQARGEGATDDEPSEGIVARIFASLARVPAPLGPVAVPEDAADVDDRFRRRAEERVRAFADAGGGVVLGWGAVGMDMPGTFRVRLHGPRPARVRQAMTLEGLDETSAARRLDETDRVRRGYMRRFYGMDWSDMSAYHLVVDTTALPTETCVSIIATAARAFWAAPDR